MLGSESPKAELKTSDPIHSNRTVFGSSDRLDDLNRLGRVRIGKTDDVLRVLSAVAGRQISVERLQHHEQDEAQRHQQEGEMEVAEDLELTLDVDVHTGMGGGVPFGGDTKENVRLKQGSKGLVASTTADSKEGWGEEGYERAGGMALYDQGGHQVIIIRHSIFFSPSFPAVSLWPLYYYYYDLSFRSGESGAFLMPIY